MDKKVIVIIIAISIVAILILGIGTAVVGPSRIINMIKGDDDDGSGGNNNTNDGGGGGGNNQNPVARIQVLDNTKNVSLTKEFGINEVVWFDASDSSGNVSYFIWGFGDGITTEGAGEKYELVNHTYDSKGQYTVNLTVVATNQARSKTSVNITILGEPYTHSTSEILSTRVGSSNATITFPVEADARNMTLSFTINGLSQDINAVLEIGIYNPFHELLGNETTSVLLQGTQDFTFLPPEISPVGNYFIELSCKSGTVRVLVDINVQY